MSKLWSPPYRLVFISPMFRLQKRSSPRFQKLSDYRSHCFLENRQMILLQEAYYNHETRDLVVVLSHHIKESNEKNAMPLLAILANLKDIFDNCGVCEEKPARVRVNLLSDAAEKVNKTHTAEGLNMDRHVFRLSWPVVTNSLIQGFLTKMVLQEASDLVSWASQNWTKTNRK